MPVSTLRRGAVVAIVAALMLVTCGLAFAFWTTRGAGSASATVGTLNPPTSVSGASTPGSAAVTVSWSASTGPVIPTGYYVTRTNSSSVSSAACNTSATVTTNGTSCSDASLAVGTYTYKVTAVYHSWTAVSAASAGVTVAQGSQTITFTSAAPAAATFGGATYTVAATGGTSGNPVTFSSGTSAVCTVSGSTVSFVGAGTCTINANQAGNVNYTAAAQQQQSFSVNKASQTIAFTSTKPTSATVGGSTYTVAATGGASGNAVTFTIDATSSSVCTITGSAVSFTAVGTCTVDANQAGNSNYSAASQAQQSFAVGQGAQSITFTSTAPTSATVGGSYIVTATASSGLAVTLSLDGTSAGCTLSGSTSGSTVNFTAGGTCKINANQAGNTNYLAAGQLQQSFAVARANQSISFTSTAPAAATFNGTTYTVSATGGASGLPVTFTSGTTTAVCTVSGAIVSFGGVGTCTINADQAGNGSYNAATTATQTFAVGKASQTITFTSTAPVGAKVGGSTYSVTATATSNLAVAFTSASPSICTVSGSTVTFVAVGACTINGNQPGGTNYNPAPQAAQSFTVTKGDQTITFTSAAPVGAKVSGSTYNVTATATSGLAVAFTSASPSICTVSGSTVTFVAVGTCTINGNQPGNLNYNAAPQVAQSFLVTKGDQTITFTSTASDPRSGGASYTVTATGGASGNPVTFTSATPTVCTVSGSAVTFIAAGPCTINANQAFSTNYNAAPQAQQTFSVGGPAPTITSPSTSSPYNAGHNTGSHVITVTGTNFVSGLTLTATGGVFTVSSFSRTSATQISVTLSGVGGNGATGSLVVTNPDGGTFTATNALQNGP